MRMESIYEAVFDGDARKAKAETEAALSDGIPAEDILYQACIPALAEVGEEFEDGVKFVPDMLMSARAMQAAMAALQPVLNKGNVKTLGTVVIGTVAGDMHDIGKNLVRMMLEGSGFEVVDLGVNVPAQKFITAVKEKCPQIVALSALLTTTMPAMKAVIRELAGAGVRERVKVLVGGAPVTQEFAVAIGADGFAPDASRAVRVAKELLSAT